MNGYKEVVLSSQKEFIPQIGQRENHQNHRGKGGVMTEQMILAGIIILHSFVACKRHATKQFKSKT